MKIHSQRLHELDCLSSSDESKILLTRDKLGGHELVFKQYSIASPARERELETQIRLSRQLGDSGFLASEDVIVEEGRLAGYTCRLIESGNLSTAASDLEDDELLAVLQSVSQTVAYLHSLGYLHRDIKPDNILIDRIDGVVRSYVIDLDFSVRLGSQHGMALAGTREFMAPEQQKGNPLTEVVDVYSFGKVLEKVAIGMRDTRLVAAIDALGKRCSEIEPTSRPQSFWDVHDSLRILHDAEFGPVGRNDLHPPLRDAGVPLRANNLRRHVMGGDGRWHGLCLIAGPGGIGKSRVTRDFALGRQIAGDETVRITEVGSPDELIQGVGSLEPELRPRSGTASRRAIWITAETLPGCSITRGDLLRLHSLARDLQVVLILEDRNESTEPPSDEIRTVRIKPFSLRECIIASSHLQSNPSLSDANGQALLIASGGNPWLLRQCLKARLTSPRRSQDEEPVNFDRLDMPTIDYWKCRYDRLPPPLQVFLGHASVFHSELSLEWLTEPDTSPDEIARQAEELLGAGWLRRIGMIVEPLRYQFVCRTARNFVRKQVGSEYLKGRAATFLARTQQLRSGTEPSPCSMWELRRLARQHKGAAVGRNLWETCQGLDDTKLATLALLIEYRWHLRGQRMAEPSSIAAGISDGFAELGSVRRKKRWATIAFSRLQGQTHGGDLSLSDVRFLCHLHDLSGELSAKHKALSALLNDGAVTDGHVKGYCLSELGTVHLLQNDFQEANSRYFESYHLLERAAPESVEYARNLNRLGLSLMRIGHYEAARKYLEQCRKLSQQFGFDHIVRLSLGNLVILERALGDPQAAMRCSRRALDGYRSARDSFGYLRALPDKVMCQVDLGHGYTALRTAQLAVWLANLHSDEFESMHALNNLGWVLMMQGETGRAHEQLEAAIRLNLRSGDQFWVVRSRLNLAWTFLLAGDLARAENLCRSGLDEIGRQNDLHGLCEAMLILAQTAIIREDLAAAGDCLSQIPRDNPMLSPRDQVETSLAWLNLHLWRGELAEAERLVTDLAKDPIVENVHPMRCDFDRMRGVWYTLQGDYDRSLDILSATASACRRGGRVDKLIDTMIALVLLAGRMRNWPIGRGYMRTVIRMTEGMRNQLQP